MSFGVKNLYWWLLANFRVHQLTLFVFCMECSLGKPKDTPILLEMFVPRPTTQEIK